MFYNASENNPEKYVQSFNDLKEFIANSLELYKAEVCMRVGHSLSHKIHGDGL